MNFNTLRATVLSAIGLLGISGCVTAPPLPEFDSQSVERVGVFVAWIGDPTHTHNGTTIFNNFGKEYPQDWDLREDFTRVLEKTLAARGMEPVDLERAGFVADDLDGLLAFEGAGWSVAKPDVLQRLQNEEVSAVIAVSPLDSMQTLSSCGMYGCVYQYARGYGLESRGKLGLLRSFFLAFAFDVTALLVEPPADITETRPWVQFLEIDGNRPSGINSKPWPHAAPADIKSLDSDTLELIRSELIAHMEELAAKLASILDGDTG